MELNHIFNIASNSDFNESAIEIFKFQAKKNSVYNSFLKHLKTDIAKVNTIKDIPFLPIQFFKSHKIVSTKNEIKKTFLSSGTTGSNQSKHFVTDLNLYEQSYIKGFKHFYGNIEDYTCLLYTSDAADENQRV